MFANEFSFNINNNNSLTTIKENFDNFKEEESAPDSSEQNDSKDDNKADK